MSGIGSGIFDYSVVLLRVIIITCITHERETVVIIKNVNTDKISAVVKSGITTATESVLVMVCLIVALFFSELDSGFVFHRRNIRTGGKSSSSPVVGSRHLFVLYLSQVTTIWIEVEKVFQFFPNDSVKDRIMKKVGRMVTCHGGHGDMSHAKKKITLPDVICHASSDIYIPKT